MSFENTEGQENKNLSDEAGSQKVFTEDEHNSIVQEKIKERLKNQQKESSRRDEESKAEVKKLQERIKELESKEKSGTASTAEQLELQEGKNAESEAQANSIPAELLPAIVQKKMKSVEFQQKIDAALEKDEEFKKLVNKGNPYEVVPQQMQQFIEHLDNAPAVLKHLFKDPKENALMRSKYADAYRKDEDSIMIEYFNNLSTKIEQGSTRPRPSSFTPNPDISDVGDSAQDFDSRDYVKNSRI